MSDCVWVCRYLLVYMCACFCMFVFVFGYIYSSLHVFAYLCMHVSLVAFCACGHTCIHACILICLCMWVCTCAFVNPHYLCTHVFVSLLNCAYEKEHYTPEVPYLNFIFLSYPDLMISLLSTFIFIRFVPRVYYLVVKEIFLHTFYLCVITYL